jgi:hypothetical protein
MSRGVTEGWLHVLLSRFICVSVAAAMQVGIALMLWLCTYQQVYYVSAFSGVVDDMPH